MNFGKLLLQFFKFTIAGTLASLTDIGCLALMKEIFGINVFIATTISFCIAVVVNYVLNMAFVFKSKNTNKRSEIVVFILLSIGGLLINQFVMYFGVALMSYYYLHVKIVAVVAEGLYNFVTRKIFIEA